MADGPAEKISSYRREKIRRYLEFRDLNSDGCLSVEDFHMACNNLIRLTNASSSQAIKYKEEILKWWDVVRKGKSNDAKIPLTEAVRESIEHILNTDPPLLQQRQTATFCKIFDLIDLNGDGIISKEELKIYYNSHCVTDDNFIDAVFNTIDENKNGVISRDEFIRALEAYWNSDDPENGLDIIYNVPKS